MKVNNKKIVSPEKSYFEEIQEVGLKIVEQTKKPLVVLFYCDTNGQILRPDIKNLFNLMSQKLGQVDDLNVLIHTNGGHPNTAYLLIQQIRKFAKNVNFLIPHHAYSGGTLMALGANQIIMGPYASLGPIDLQLFGGRLPLLNIDKYVEFVKHAKEITSDNRVGEVEGRFSTELLLQLTKEIPPTKIGELFRLRKLSEYYAKILLSDYMFANLDYRQKNVERIVKRLNSDYPDHSFDIDINIAKGLGLEVNLMKPDLFYLTDSFINLCELSKRNGEICPFVDRDKCEGEEEDFRIPYFEAFKATEKTR